MGLHGRSTLTTRTNAKRKPAPRRPRNSGPPPDHEVREQLAKARVGLEAGRAFDDIFTDMKILVGVGLLHPRTPEHVASILREVGGAGRQREEKAGSASEQRSRSTSPMPDDHELLGVVPGASRETIEAAHRKAILACHPDRFAALSPAIQRAMDDLAARLNGARSRLLGE